jgi:DNA helicase-2/ATP-dependent DNA helicase PcrA
MNPLLKSEQKHLQNTIAPIKGKLQEVKKELKDLEKSYNEGLMDVATAGGLDERLEALSDLNKMMSNQNFEYKHNTVLKRLESQVNTPYFAKLDFSEPDQQKTSYYIGRFAYFPDNDKYRIIDWRAPFASLYYNYTQPTENAVFEINPEEEDQNTKKITGKIHTRINFDIEKSKILAIYDNSLRVDLLKLRIKEKSGGRLTDIIDTIQKTQNEIIRAKPDRVCIVQGTAGSGKTTIAIHRLSYLLYTYKEKLKESNTVLFSSSKVLINYVASTLPELDIMSIERYTLEEYLANVLLFNDIEIDPTRVKHKKEKGSEYLNSWEFINYVNTYANVKKQEIMQEFKEQLFYEDLKLDRFFLRTINKPIFENLKTIEHNLTYRHFSLKQELKKGNFTVEDEIFDLEDALEYLAHLFKKFSLENEYKNLLVEFSLEHNKKIPFDPKNIHIDHMSALFLLASLFYSINLKNKTFRQIIVDEAQDLGILNYFVIKHFSNNSGFTILGDLNQATGGIGTIKNWNDIEPIFGETEVDFFEIKVSYRTTKQIIDLAKSILKKHNQKHLPQAFERKGDKPVIKKFISRKEIIKTIAKELKQREKNDEIRATAVIEPDAENIKQTQRDFEKHGINLKWINSTFENFSETGNYLVSDNLVKGLEFDTVYILNPTEKLIPNTPTGAKRMFVLVTRAINSLKIYYTSKPNTLIT